MANYWQQKLQSSLQSSLQTVNSTVNTISTDGAARCVAACSSLPLHPYTAGACADLTHASSA